MENKVFISHFHWSNEVIAITCIGLCITVGCLIPLILSKVYLLGLLWLKWALVVTLIVPVIYTATWTPRYISVCDDHFVFKKMRGHIIIPVQTIRDVYEIDANSLKGSIRTFGSGGVFGYLGRFKNNILGNYSMYITEKKHLIAVKTHDKTFVFNCNDPNRLVTLIKTQ